MARIYDYLLGGKDNFAADREAAGQLIAAIPDVAAIARDNRSFLGRVVRYLAGQAGIRQFLDLGGGLPTRANVHELAQGVAPDVRVVYVDNDPVVASHGLALLFTRDRVAMVLADLRDPATVWQHPDCPMPCPPTARASRRRIRFTRDDRLRRSARRFR